MLQRLRVWLAFLKASEFDLKALERVEPAIQIFISCQILRAKFYIDIYKFESTFYYVLDVNLKHLQSVRFRTENFTMCVIWNQKLTKCQITNQNFTSCQILNPLAYKVAVIKTENRQPVRLGFKIFTTIRDFAEKILQRFRSGIEIFQSVKFRNKTSHRVRI